MYFKIFHRAWWFPQNLRPSGPWRRACEVSSFLHRGQRSRLLEKPAGLGLCGLERVSELVSEKLGSRSGSPPPLTQQQRRKFLSQDRREQLLWLRPWKYISGTRRRHLRSDHSPGSPRLPQLGFGPFPPKSTTECGPGPVPPPGPPPAEKSNLNRLRRDFPLRSPRA